MAHKRHVAQGGCWDCKQQAKPNSRRCFDCTEKHRQRNRRREPHRNRHKESRPKPIHVSDEERKEVYAWLMQLAMEGT